MQPISYTRPDGSTAPPPPPPRKRPKWLLWGCLPAIAVVLLLVAIAAGLRAYQQDAEVNRSNGTVLPPNTQTTPVPNGGGAVTATCAVQQGLIQRDCAIITPPGVPEGTKMPVVFLLHGFGDGPVEVRGSGDWANAVVEHQFVLVTPAGVLNSWNAGGCCGPAKGTNIDDVGYLTTLVQEIAKRPDVDPTRIFMAGFSNGGMMMYRFLCDSGDLIEAAASVAGTKVTQCVSKRPIPLLHIHGTADETVPYEGGAGPVAAIMGSSFQNVPDMIDKLAVDEGCTSAPSERVAGDLTTKEWNGCADGSRLKFITIDGWPHQWPLDGSLNATDEILTFFGIT